MAAVVEPTPLNLLTIDVNGAVVRVKVFVTWKKTYFNNPNSAMSLEMILVDAQDNKIRASVRKRWISFYEPTFVEGKYLELSNFGVVDCDDKVKLIPNALKISIFRSTTITVCPLFDIATEGFSPVHFQELLEWRFSKDAVFDVLGALVEMKPMRIKHENGVDNKSLEFTLKDNSGIAIRCALWAHHATRVFEYVSARKNDIDSIVLLMHNCKLREWQGVPQVSNQLWGCRVYINDDIPAINRFKAE
ncbi:replication protein A 70 kDa DNA-binding subunit A-like [Rutidosis leptorrhynchoides]|uniref:replication protein A 70 kDa DNA-binding subunit A-like n=1 Tax=Rutidosis leptorrhynchoides TaxID=125765 RepID=UPI003A99837F